MALLAPLLAYDTTEKNAQRYGDLGRSKTLFHFCFYVIYEWYLGVVKQLTNGTTHYVLRGYVMLEAKLVPHGSHHVDF